MQFQNHVCSFKISGGLNFEVDFLEKPKTLYVFLEIIKGYDIMEVYTF